jgi:hypothetical protein
MIYKYTYEKTNDAVLKAFNSINLFPQNVVKYPLEKVDVELDSPVPDYLKMALNENMRSIGYVFVGEEIIE